MFHNKSYLSKWQKKFSKLRWESLREPPPYPEQWPTESDENIDLESDIIVEYLKVLKEHHSQNSSWWIWIPIWLCQNTILLPIMCIVYIVYFNFPRPVNEPIVNGLFRLVVPLSLPFILPFSILFFGFFGLSRREWAEEAMRFFYSLLYSECIRRMLWYLPWAEIHIGPNIWWFLGSFYFIYMAVFQANYQGVRFAWWRSSTWLDGHGYIR